MKRDALGTLEVAAREAERRRLENAEREAAALAEERRREERLLTELIPPFRAAVDRAEPAHLDLLSSRSWARFVDSHARLLGRPIDFTKGPSGPWDEPKTVVAHAVQLPDLHLEGKASRAIFQHELRRRPFNGYRYWSWRFGPGVALVHGSKALWGYGAATLVRSFGLRPLVTWFEKGFVEPEGPSTDIAPTSSRLASYPAVLRLLEEVAEERPLCAKMSETPSRLEFTVEGGEGHLHEDEVESC